MACLSPATAVNLVFNIFKGNERSVINIEDINTKLPFLNAFKFGTGQIASRLDDDVETNLYHPHALGDIVGRITRKMIVVWGGGFETT